MERYKIRVIPRVRGVLGVEAEEASGRVIDGLMDYLRLKEAARGARLGAQALNEACMRMRGAVVLPDGASLDDIGEDGLSYRRRYADDLQSLAMCVRRWVAADGLVTETEDALAVAYRSLARDMARGVDLGVIRVVKCVDPDGLCYHVYEIDEVVEEVCGVDEVSDAYYGVKVRNYSYLKPKKGVRGGLVNRFTVASHGDNALAGLFYSALGASLMGYVGEEGGAE